MWRGQLGRRRSKLMFESTPQPAFRLFSALSGLRRRRVDPRILTRWQGRGGNNLVLVRPGRRHPRHGRLEWAIGTAMEHTLSVLFVATLGCFAMRTTQVLPTTTFDSVNLEMLHSSATGTATASSGLACDKLTRTTGASASLQLPANPHKGLNLVYGPMVWSPATGKATAARPTPRGDLSLIHI